MICPYLRLNVGLTVGLNVGLNLLLNVGLHPAQSVGQPMDASSEISGQIAEFAVLRPRDMKL